MTVSKRYFEKCARAIYRNAIEENGENDQRIRLRMLPSRANNTMTVRSSGNVERGARRGLPCQVSRRKQNDS